MATRDLQKRINKIAGSRRNMNGAGVAPALLRNEKRQKVAAQKWWLVSHSLAHATSVIETYVGHSVYQQANDEVRRHIQEH